MKALTVKQPWAWAVIHGGKDIENRNQRINYRGELFIHAGKGEDSEAHSFPALNAVIPNDYPALRRGQVLGTVALIGCHNSETCGNSCSVWAEDGCWHWELADARAIPFPYPATGKLGLWNLEQPPNHSEPTTESHRADGT
jgi:hypothetical protein